MKRTCLIGHVFAQVLVVEGNMRDFLKKWEGLVCWSEGLVNVVRYALEIISGSDTDLERKRHL